MIGFTAAEFGYLGEESQRTADSVINTVNGVAFDPTKISIDNAELPKNIGVVAASTVEVVSRFKEPESAHGGETGIRLNMGSGTTINYKGAKLVITAAHVVDNTTNSCGDERIRFLQSGSAPSSITTRAVSQTPSRGNEGLYDGSRDAVAVRPNFWYDELEQEMVGLQVQPKVRLKKGDRIFSLGYGPRYDFDPSPIDDDANKRKPVIVPGTVIDVGKKSIKFITGVKSGVDAATDSIYPGDSGGTVVGGDGKYIGLVTERKAPASGRKFGVMYGLDLPPQMDYKQLTVATADIVDESTVEAMASAMRPCTSALTDQ